MHCHRGTNNRAPRWTFTDPCKPEVRPGAREESASPAWLAPPAMNARDTTKVYIWRLDIGCGQTLYYYQLHTAKGTSVTKMKNTKELMHCHCGSNNRAPRWTFMDPGKPEVKQIHLYASLQQNKKNTGRERQKQKQTKLQKGEKRSRQVWYTCLVFLLLLNNRCSKNPNKILYLKGYIKACLYPF